MNTQSGVRGLTFGALMAGLALVVQMFVPLPGAVSLPITMVYLRHGLRAAVLSGAVAVLLAGIFRGPLASLGMVILGAVPGLVLGWGILAGLKPTLTVLAQGGAYFFAMLVSEGLGRLLIKQSPYLLTLKQFQRTQQSMSGLIPPEQREAFEFSQQLLETAVPLLLPAIIALGALMSALLAYWVARTLLPRFGHKVEALPAFAHWRMPQELSWALSAGILLSLSRGFGLPEWAARIGDNVTFLLFFLYSFQGLAVVYQFLRKREVAKAAAFLIALIPIFVIPPAGPAYALLGVLDSVFNFRKIGVPRQNEGDTPS